MTGTLGAGAMGEVFAAVDDVLGRDVAVKTLLGSVASRMADERFRNEARAIARFSHPGVVQLFDIDLDAQPPFLVMERVVGPSLKERIAAGPLAVGEVCALGIQIARALAAAHAQNVVHRDVKPANILRAGEGVWKLADFGVAHVPDSGLTMTGQFVGSPAYASPEALVKGLCDPEGDVFGLGASLYHAASGTWPRLDASTSGLLAPVPSLATIAPHVPSHVVAAIDTCLDIDAARRPTAAALAEALARPAATAIARPVMPASPKRPHAGYLAIGVGVLLLVGIAAVASRSGGAPAVVTAMRESAAAPAAAPSPPVTADEPTRLLITTPPMSSEKAAKDWNKILDHLRRGNLGEARKKLGEWERKHGPTSETADLRRQLEAVDPEPDRRGPPHHGHEDD